jgi:histidine ammonia-lyase
MIQIGQSTLSLNDFAALVYKHTEVALDKAALEKVKANFEFLKKFSSNKLIYGINTGFGPMAQYKVSEENILQLQYNLIRSHSSGSGKLIPAQLSRALMVTRLNSFMKAYSGVHNELTELLRDMINHDICPCIYEHGGVGASGDLVQLAHLGLSLIGEGEVQFEGGIHPTMEIFNRFGLKPLSIHIREGLAVINGTSAMTGIGLINIIQAKKLLNWAVLFSAMINEVVQAFDDHYSHELNIVKHHTGQNAVAGIMRDILKDSK